MIRYDYDIPVTQAIRSLIHHHGKITRYGTLTMAKTIARMLGIPEDDGYPALDAAWRTIPNEYLRFAKWYDSSRQIIALVNVNHEDYKKALESEAEVSRQRMENEVDNFNSKEEKLYEFVQKEERIYVVRRISAKIQLRLADMEQKQLER